MSCLSRIQTSDCWMKVRDGTIQPQQLARMERIANKMLECKVTVEEQEADQGSDD